MAERPNFLQVRTTIPPCRTRRFFRLGKPVTIPWNSLQLQFGCGYKNLRHFKRRFLKYLKSVISYYPEVRIANADAGLLLKPSPPHVPRRSASRIETAEPRPCT